LEIAEGGNKNKLDLFSKGLQVAEILLFQEVIVRHKLLSLKNLKLFDGHEEIFTVCHILGFA
jgi:hypothetical protein